MPFQKNLGVLIKSLSVLPFVKRHVSNTTFSITFLVLLHDAEREGSVQNGISKNIYRDVLADMLPTFKLEFHMPPAKRSREYSFRPPGYVNRPLPPQLSLMDGGSIAALIDSCRSMGLTEERDALMSHLMTSSRTADVSAFHSVLVPTLTKLITMSQEASSSLQEPALRLLFRGVLKNYIQRYVGVEPSKPRDWAVRPRGCGCGDCGDLDAFLVSPKEMVGRFRLGKGRRQHLHGRLNSARGITHETERHGNPQTLVVSKTLNGWQHSHSEWAERNANAKKSFEAMGTANLREILGDELEEILNSNAPKSASARDDETPVSTARASMDALKARWLSSDLNAGACVSARENGTPVSAKRTLMDALNPLSKKRRTAMKTLSQPNSRSINPAPAAKQQPDSETRLQIVDLTEE